MNAMNFLLSRAGLIRISMAVCGVALASCKSTQNTSGDPYASYPADGSYHPYPAGQEGKYKYQQYTEAPPPPAYSGSDEGGSSKKKKKGTSDTSSSKSKSKSSSKSGTKSKKSSDDDDTPHKSSSSSSTTHKKKSSSSSSSTYTVKSSDTLYGIAKKHHTTVSKIKSLNGLKSDTIHGGQKLKLP
jgi:LysM repeat protein